MTVISHAPAAVQWNRRQWVQAAVATPLLTALGGCAHPTQQALATPEALAAARWATGGTRAIGTAARALNPFMAAATACRLTCEATIGPCHTTSPMRVDVSDGWDGLPLHMVLRVVDTDCRPVADAIVEIWHTNYTGGYSGQIVAMCNNNPDDVDKQFFRGYQRSDAHGVVRFDSCYPGWYRGRANHVHVRVMKGSYDPSDRAVAWNVTQLLFPDALNQSIFAQQPLYKDHGQPDTTLAQDGIVGGEANLAPYLFDVHHVDGVMVASKTLTIRTRRDAASCQVQGRMPAGWVGRKGPPPRFAPGADPAPGGMGPANGRLPPR